MESSRTTLASGRHSTIWNWTLLVILLALCAGLLRLAPAEQTLGQTIKLVYLHGALIRASLIAFAAAGVLGILWLITIRAFILSWMIAVQRAALVVWIVCIFSSLIVTYAAWGVAVAWGEPRVIAILRVSLAVLIIFIVTSLMRLPVLTAAGNIALAIISIFVIQTAGVVLHPTNPIGESSSLLIQGYYVAIVLVICAIAATLASIFHRR